MWSNTSRERGQQRPPDTPPQPGLDPVRSRINTVVGVPYFTPAQIERLFLQSCGASISLEKWEALKAPACGFIAAAGAKLGLCVHANSPQRTIATAQILFHRFHLFYSPTDFVWHEVTLACLFCAAKLNDTLKKLHEFILAGYAVQNPDLIPAPEDSSCDWIAQGRIPEGTIESSVSCD